MSLTLRELLKDPIYKAWYMKVPIEHSVGTFPWRIWVQLENEQWTKTKVDYAKYSEAYNWIARNLRKYPDLVLYSKGHDFRPPVISKNGKKQYYPMPVGYRWCGYCRRPTEFAYFSTHHAMKGIPIDQEVKRCSICGARANFVKAYGR